MTSFAYRLTLQVRTIGRQTSFYSDSFFQEFRPEILWRSGNIWPTLWRKVHEIPILPPKYWPLIIRVSLA